MSVDINSMFYRLRSQTDLRPRHLSLLLALLYLASNQRPLERSIRISRKSLMTLSKIRSATTYHQTIRDLCSMGIISYNSSFDPRKFTEVVILSKHADSC